MHEIRDKVLVVQGCMQAEILHMTPRSRDASGSCEKIQKRPRKKILCVQGLKPETDIKTSPAVMTCKFHLALVKTGLQWELEPDKLPVLNPLYQQHWEATQTKPLISSKPTNSEGIESSLVSLLLFKKPTCTLLNYVIGQ